MSKKRGKAKATTGRRPKGKRGHKPWCDLVMAGGGNKCTCGSTERGGRR